MSSNALASARPTLRDAPGLNVKLESRGDGSKCGLVPHPDANADGVVLTPRDDSYAPRSRPSTAASASPSYANQAKSRPTSAKPWQPVVPPSSASSRATSPVRRAGITPAWRSDPKVNPSGKGAPVPSQRDTTFQARDAREDPNWDARPARSHQTMPSRYRDPAPQQSSSSSSSSNMWANYRLGAQHSTSRPTSRASRPTTPQNPDSQKRRREERR